MKTLLRFLFHSRPRNLGGVLIGLSSLTQLFACEGTEFGNPSTVTGSVEMALVSSDSSVATVGVAGSGGSGGSDGNEDADTSSGTLQINSAWLTLEEVGGRECSPGDGSAESEVVWTFQPTVVDLIEGSPRKQTEFELPGGSEYCTLYFRAGKIDTTNAEGIPEAAAENELYLGGTTARDQPFELRWPDIERRLRFPINGPFSGGRLALTFDIIPWLEGIDLVTAVENEEGVVILSPTENSELFEIFAQNFDESVRLASETNPGATIVQLMEDE